VESPRLKSWTPNSRTLRALSRTDKWYLGGGNRLLWAPEFPLFLDRPGFWDRAHYYNVPLEPLFTWTLLDEQGNELPLRSAGRRWNPAVLVQEFATLQAGSGISVEETKSLLPNDVLVSALRVRNKGSKKRKLHLILWTAQESHPGQKTTWLSDVSAKGTISFTRHIKSPQRPEMEIACSLGISRKVRSFDVQLSEGRLSEPRWELTPFPEQFRASLPGGTKQIGADHDGIVYAALHIALTVKGRKEETVIGAFSAAPSPVTAEQSLLLILRQRDHRRLSELSWNDHFDFVPTFECSDEFLERYYSYRWYGLRLNTMYGGEGNYQYPFVCEGIGYFRAPISYSAPCHMLENRWMHEPELARGSFLTFLDNQRDDGGFRGYIDVDHYRQEMFYHANWGKAVLELDAIHPSREFLEQAYEGLKKYAAYYDRERDEEVSGLYDIDNHYETGQEYMHRYLAVNPKADQDHWGEVFRLKGVDVTVYVYELKRALATIAERLGKDADKDLWNLEADRTKKAVLNDMWDARTGMFFDVDPSTGKRTGVKAAVCFYPYFTDIVSEHHLAGFKKHLFNPKEFWTPYPVPSSSADDKYFSAEPVWKGKRMNCPWNGRVWPMTNSHTAEAMAAAALRFGDTTLRRKTAQFIKAFIHMMFYEGDPLRPNCFEHYNPLTGDPSVYRGIDDYQHSWVNDLIIKYVCGIRPEAHSVTIDPFPFGLDHVKITRVVVRGRAISVEIKGKTFKVLLDEAHQAESTLGKPVSLQI